MPQLYFDLLFCSMFIIILLIMMKYRHAAFSRDMAAYRRIVSGILLFTGLSVIQLAGHLGAFSGISYMENGAGMEIIEVTMIMGGLIFLLSGLGSWLPSLARSRKTGRRLNKRYYCLKMANEALVRGKNLDDTYNEIMSCLSSYLAFNGCAVYKYSSARDSLFLSGTTGAKTEMNQCPDRIALGDTELRKALQRFRSTIVVNGQTEWEGDRKPDIIVPIAHNNRLYGAYIFWVGESINIDDDLLDFLSIIGNMTGRHTETHVANIRQEYHRAQQTSYEQISDVCNQSATVRDMIPRLFRIIKDLVGAEYLSVASLDNSGENMVRYTIGSSGRLLLEKGVSRQTRGTDIYTVFETGRSRVEQDIHPDDMSGEQDGLFLSCGMKSKITCPVKAGNKVVGVLTIGHTDGHHFSRYHLNRVEPITDFIAGIIRRDQLCRSLEVKEDHMLRLQLMQRQMLDNPPAQSFFDDACELLTKRMNCTVARISLIDNGRINLVSQACRSVRNTGNELHENEAIPLSLLPWHRMTLDAKKLMLINQDDPESRMPPQESTSSLIPNIKSAMLVPIMLDDSVKGIISIGEARNWNRRTFGATDLIFAKDLAAKCSLALRMKRMELDVERNRDEVNRLAFSEEETLPELRTRLKSPLTSIIGAVELLRMKSGSDNFSTRYFDLILKSADRIKNISENRDDGILEVEEVGPETVIG